MTGRDLVSRVRTMLKLQSSDELTSDRSIFQEILSTNIKLCVQQLSKRQSSNAPSLFTDLECIEMEKVPLTSCCDYVGDCQISKSKLQIPLIVDYLNTLAVGGVWTIDRKSSFIFTNSPNRYADFLKLELKSKKKFYFILNGYLYVTDPELEKVSLSAFFAEPTDPILYSCKKPDKYCSPNPLDLEFKGLPKVTDDVITIVFKKIQDTYKRSVADVQENDMQEGK